MAGRRKFIQASKELEYILLNCNSYRTEIKKYYEMQGITYQAKKIQKNTFDLQPNKI